MDIVFPFKYDLRQLWTNFEKEKDDIDNIKEFIEYIKMLNIDSLIFNIGSNLSEHDLVYTNYQIFPQSLQNMLEYLNENITIVNVDPEFIFDDIVTQLTKRYPNLEITKKTNSLLHICININKSRIDLIFSRSLMPSYDPEGCKIIMDYAVQKNQSLLEDIKKFSTTKADRDFVIYYYNILENIIALSLKNNHIVIIINYALKFNLIEKGLYFGFFKEFLHMLSIFPKVHIFEYYSFKINTRIYANVELKSKKYGDVIKYRPFNSLLQTGDIDTLDPKFNNKIIVLDSQGKINIEYLNNDNKDRLLINYN